MIIVGGRVIAIEENFIGEMIAAIEDLNTTE